MYDGIAVLVGARVIAVDDDNVYFNNGLRLSSEDIGNYLEIVKAPQHTDSVEELKAEIGRVIDEWKAQGLRKANLEIELIHFIKGRLYGDD